MKDFRLNWAPPAQPLGDALREPVVIIDTKAMERDGFRFVCHDIPEPMAGKAKAEPAVAPAVDVQPAAFKVGDRVRLTKRYACVNPGDGAVIPGGFDVTVTMDYGAVAFFSTASALEYLQLIPAQREQVVEPMGR
jgi:hypothetical protein